MKHDPEFSRPSPQREEARDLSAAYCRLFTSEDGKRVLKDLLAKFPTDAPRFYGHSDMVTAAKIDGRADVTREITQAIEAGSPITGISTTPTPNP